MSEETISAANDPPQAACERCGKPEAAKFGEEFICDECYSACGSCCAGEDQYDPSKAQHALRH